MASSGIPRGSASAANDAATAKVSQLGNLMERRSEAAA
jgi:hypothetical protein